MIRRRCGVARTRSRNGQAAADGRAARPPRGGPRARGAVGRGATPPVARRAGRGAWPSPHGGGGCWIASRRKPRTALPPSRPSRHGGARQCPDRRRPGRDHPDPAIPTPRSRKRSKPATSSEACRPRSWRRRGTAPPGRSTRRWTRSLPGLAILLSDPDIHLLLAELYLDRGWRGPAADKAGSAGRLTQLTDDATPAPACASWPALVSPTTRVQRGVRRPNPALSLRDDRAERRTEARRRETPMYTRERCPSSSRSSIRLT